MLRPWSKHTLVLRPRSKHDQGFMIKDLGTRTTGVWLSQTSPPLIEVRGDIRGTRPTDSWIWLHVSSRSFPYRRTNGRNHRYRNTLGSTYCKKWLLKYENCWSLLSRSLVRTYGNWQPCPWLYIEIDARAVHAPTIVLLVLSHRNYGVVLRNALPITIWGII